MSDNQALDALRGYAVKVDRLARFVELRDAEILRLRNSINPDTGRQWTWRQLAVAAHLSPMGAVKASERAEKQTPGSLSA